MHPHRSEARDALTAPEALTAQLAPAGHTDTELRRKVFLSARAVRYHLKQTFTKLDVGPRIVIHPARLDRPPQVKPSAQPLEGEHPRASPAS
jgi:hypothetical protein